MRRRSGGGGAERVKGPRPPARRAARLGVNSAAWLTALPWLTCRGSQRRRQQQQRGEEGGMLHRCEWLVDAIVSAPTLREQWSSCWDRLSQPADGVFRQSP